MSAISRVRLAITYLLLSVKSLFFGSFLLLRLIAFVIHTSYLKWRAAVAFEMEARRVGVPPDLARELRKSYDFRWRNLVKRW